MGTDEAARIAPRAQAGDEKVMFDSLRLAIGDTQSMIRGYDTKAQVLIAVLTFAVGTLGKAIDEQDLATPLVVIVVAAVVAAFICCACVVYPRAPAMKARTTDDLETWGTYFIPPPLVAMSLRDLVQRMRDTDWLTELTYELQKLASVRQRKAYWFKWSFISTAAVIVGLYAVLLFG